MTAMPPPDRCAVIIEDDEEISELLATVLNQAGFQTHIANNGMSGLELIGEHDPVVTTLDVNLPGMDGFEVARRIRSFSSTYVIMLSARRDEIDTLTGLNSGADDYLAKPFRPRELRARIEAMLRRRELDQHTQRPVASQPSSVASDSLEHNGLRLHPSMRVVELDGQPIELTRREFDLIAALMQHPKRVLSKDELTSLTRGDGDTYVIEADRRSIESHMANLRRKLADSPTRPRFIETVRGVGYRLANPARVPTPRPPVAPHHESREIVGSVEGFSTRVANPYAGGSRARSDEAMDPVTGLLPRGLGELHLQTLMGAVSEQAGTLGVLFLDADHFKTVNDTFGHKTGDEVLRMIGQSLANGLRRGDLPVRWGGEEFVALLPGTDMAGLLATAERVRMLTENSWIQKDEAQVRVTVSVGATLALPGETPLEVVDRADALMYASKRGGRNCVTTDSGRLTTRAPRPIQGPAAPWKTQA